MNNIHTIFPSALSTNLLLRWLAFFSMNTLSAQTLITLQHNGQSSFFSELQPALIAAVDGDTVYLPGGAFPEFHLDKSLHILGVGYHQDSTNATTRTIVSVINLYNGADGGSIQGIYFTNRIVSFGMINGFTISRCYITNGIKFSYITNCENYLIYENTLSSVYSESGYSQSNFFISNNIFTGIITTINSSQISNNVFLNYNSFPCERCLIKNNILENSINGALNGFPNNSVFENNLNFGITGVDGSGNQGSGNFLDNVPLNVIYPGYTTSTVNKVEDYLTLHPNSPYKNAGTDNTEIGIYGGLYPWKAGGVPYNPHIQAKTIAPTTNAQGSLNVQIKVSAQDH